MEYDVRKYEIRIKRNTYKYLPCTRKEYRNTREQNSQDTGTNLENANSCLLVFDFLPEASLPTIYRNPAKTCQ